MKVTRYFVVGKANNGDYVILSPLLDYYQDAQEYFEENVDYFSECFVAQTIDVAYSNSIKEE